MRRIWKLAILAIICISWSQTTSAIMTPLGIVDYTNYLQVDIVFPGEVELEYVYSSIDEDALEMEKLTYIPVTNTTRYLFTSALYYPEYWEHLDVEPFIFQDINSKNLYVVNINMSGIEIPEDPWKLDYINISLVYNETFQELNETIHNLTSLQEEFNELLTIHTNMSAELNETLADNYHLEAQFENISSQLITLRAEMNATEENLRNMTSDATTYRTFFEEMNSYKSNFNFKLGGDNDQYTTIYEYELQQERLEEQVKGFPVSMFFAVVVTIVLCLLFGYWKWAKKRSSPEEMAMLEGVDPTTTKVNRFKSRLRIKPKNVKVKAVAETKNEPPVSPPIEDKYEKYSREVDEKIGKLDTKINTNQTEIMGRLELLLGTKSEAKPTQ